MCGISGMFRWDAVRPACEQILRAMNASIHHRGPDSDGFHVHGPIGLAMRRLAIIDVASGRQPISNEDGSVWIVFNGEIYNHHPLRAELERHGHVFRTHSDTEAIVHAYEQYGTDCVRHLRGMFAFAIWDAPRRRLFIARDRAGKKPLYFGEYDGTFWFGSELKCLLAVPGFPRQADFTALHHFFSLQYIDDPRTCFAGVHKLPPAHTLIAENGTVKVERYWDLDFSQKRTGSRQELQSALRAKIEESVRIRLESEVPLGAHLSGGLDSSIIVGLMARMASGRVRTFSIGFEEAAFDETGFARDVAKHFGTDHEAFTVRPDALGLLPQLVDHFDEPFADPAAVPLWHLCELTRRHVTVALNGDGGDEVFGGYQRYFADPLVEWWKVVPRPLRAMLSRLLARLPSRPGEKPVEKDVAAALGKLESAASFPRAASVVRWGSYFLNPAEDLFTPDFLAHVQTTDRATSAMEQSWSACQARSGMERTLYVDWHHYLPGALLVKADRVSMAHSLESRSPFLDHELAEFAAGLPPSWKVQGTGTKRVLRELFRDILPNHIVGRSKLGFSVPLGRWFAGAQLGSVRDILLNPSAESRDWLRRERVEALINENAAGRADHGKKLWMLLNFETWMQRRLRVPPVAERTSESQL